jgi:ATP-binding cassette subfamily C (CFTR/MRP) protein 1
MALSGVVVIGALISASASYFLASIPVVLGAVYAVQKVYLRTSRQIRLLDLEAKGPLYSHFAETLSGLVSIRAFGWVDNFREQHLRLLDESQKPYYLLFYIQRWLQVVLDLLVAGLAVLLVVIVVQLRASINPGLVGLGLLNIMTFNINLAELIKAWTMLETSLGAISRLKDFVSLTDSEVKSHENQVMAGFWPEEGTISIKGFSASYGESSDVVLKDITLDIRAGEKLGICGRSGSGKSSLLASLFHLLEYREGFTSIDGQDIALVLRDLLRQRLNCITQDPY